MALTLECVRSATIIFNREMRVNIVTWHVSVSLYLFRCHRTPSGASISAKKVQIRQISRNVVYIIRSVGGGGPAFAGITSLPNAIFDLFTRMCEDKERFHHSGPTTDRRNTDDCSRTSFVCTLTMTVTPAELSSLLRQLADGRKE